MATSTSLAGHRGEPFGHHGRAVAFDPSTFGMTHVAARNAGIKRAIRRRQIGGGGIGDGHGIGQDAMPLTDFCAGHYPERF
jgi:hypothetical protein